MRSVDDIKDPASLIKILQQQILQLWDFQSIKLTILLSIIWFQSQTSYLLIHGTADNFFIILEYKYWFVSIIGEIKYITLKVRKIMITGLLTTISVFCLSMYIHKLVFKIKIVCICSQISSKERNEMWNYCFEGNVQTLCALYVSLYVCDCRNSSRTVLISARAKIHISFARTPGRIISFF